VELVAQSADLALGHREGFPCQFMKMSTLRFRFVLMNPT
jgi:hypothetical protein